MSYGTCPCPQFLETALCPESATVDENPDGTFACACPDGHEHHFDDRYLPNVTET